MRWVLALVAAACLLASAPSWASKLDPLVREGLARARAGVSIESLRESGVAVNDQGELDVFITGPVDRAALEAAGARVRTALPGVFTAFVPAAAIDRVAALADVASIHGAVRMEPQLNLSVPTTGADQLRGPGPDFSGLNGAGVIVGVMDTGVDYDHPDFKNPDGTTRFLSIWDHTNNAGPPPSGFGYGTEWSAGQINSHACTEIDDDGHGTHVIGIAGGDGSATGGSVPAFTYVGMAPKADLIMVKTNFSTSIVDGVAYIMNRASALGKNAVVNLSLGTLFGPKDGTSPFESALSALCGPGHIVVCAAGNSGNHLVHAETVTPANGSSSITLSCDSQDSASVKIDGYYAATGNLSLTVKAPGGSTYGPVALGNHNATYPGTLTTRGRIYFEDGESLTATGDREVYIELSVPGSSGASIIGVWTFTFTNAGGAPVGVDLWTFHNNVAANYVQGSQPTEKMVIEPANAYEVITAGAYFSRESWVDCGDRFFTFGSPWQVGMLAPFSSQGPTRDGRQKPDITAPGVGVGSATTFDLPVTCPPAVDRWLNDGMEHYVNDGTSMSAPHVAGAAALLMQKYGAMTPAQIKSFLIARAVTDGFTGSVWNKDWGWGKLFLGDLTDPLAHVDDPNGGGNYAIGSNAKLLWTASDAYQGVTAVDLQLTRSDGGPVETIALGVPNTGSYDWTVTGPATAQARLQVTARDAANNAGLDASDGTFSIVDAAGVPGNGIADFRLDLRAANPARGPIDMEFAVPRQSSLSLAVFDLAGRKVVTLARGIHEPGRYPVRWDGASRGEHGAGVYFVRLSAPGRELVKRIVIAE